MTPSDHPRAPARAAARPAAGKKAWPAGAAAALCAAVLSGCASDPLRHHSLRPEGEGGTAPAASAATAGGALHVVQVGVPAIVDRGELVLGTAEGGYTVMERHRWTASAAEELRTALAARLVRRLGARDVDGLGPQAGEAVTRVRVMVRRFDAVPRGEVALDADWTVAVTPAAGSAGAARPAAPAPLACASRDREAAGDGVDAVVQATRRLLDRMADAMAAAAVAAGAGRGCPPPAAAAPPA